ncbi:hypothetical protein [Bradyrhizobium erythrophlei]|nr:hypothetical protein [Bradyrhizobium erythrophlei]
MNLAELEALVVEQGRRLALAESDITALKANQGFRKVTPLAASVAAEPEGARITLSIERAKIALPNEDELRKLLDVVFGTYPTLRPWTHGSSYAFQDEQNFTRQFSAAFGYVSSQGRADEIDMKHSVSWWADQASDWLRHRGDRTDIGGAAFLAACVAAGDVAFQRSDQFGNVWAVGLASWEGRKATEAWRNVLCGELRRPVPGIHKAPERSSLSVRR